MSSTTAVNLGVECFILAVYLILSVFAGILYIGRKSYKCCLLPITKSQLMSRTKASRQLASEIQQRWFLDLLVTSLFSAVIQRTVSEALRVVDYGYSTAYGGNNGLNTATTIVLLISLTSYSMVFCALIWMWLRLSIAFLDEDERKRSCIRWTVRITTIACLITTLIVLVGLTVVFSINLLKTSFVTFMVVVMTCIAAYVLSLASLCTVVIILGIRLAVLIKKTTSASQSARVEESENDAQVNKNIRTALLKISFAVGAFILALVIRSAGTVLFMLTNYVPIWIGSLILIALPEFVTFSVLVGILWPFKVKCCIMYDESTLEKSGKENNLSATELPKSGK